MIPNPGADGLITVTISNTSASNLVKKPLVEAHFQYGNPSAGTQTFFSEAKLLNADDCR